MAATSAAAQSSDNERQDRINPTEEAEEAAEEAGEAAEKAGEAAESAGERAIDRVTETAKSVVDEVTDDEPARILGV